MKTITVTGVILQYDSDRHNEKDVDRMVQTVNELLRDHMPLSQPQIIAMREDIQIETKEL